MEFSISLSSLRPPAILPQLYKSSSHGKKWGSMAKASSQNPYYMAKIVVIASGCLFARVLVENSQLFRWSLLCKAFPGLIAILLLNGFHNGMNEIFDVDIDRSKRQIFDSRLKANVAWTFIRVNKPYLPIPSGDLSLEQAWLLVIFAVFSGLLILRWMNADLITTSIYCLAILLCTSYSAPPFRFKQSSVATSIVNPTIGGILPNIGVLYATRASLGLPFQWSPSTVFITTFMTLFFLVITNIKDLTDVKGDIKHNIRTFPAIYGPRKVVFFFTGILLLDYIGSMVVSIYMPQAFKPYIMAPAHAIFSLWLLIEAKKLDKANYTKVIYMQVLLIKYMLS
ncbi:hypothetical protein TIFTF001_025090 [Ficus carica]|uniref:Prenyltransferase n=1 Tax=Ficus carica TaxID=3494 RepID=A0AA88AI61_FICCA|nr:hypothetical protein TIFTF001_025090 [Ficus carica]